MVGKQNIIISKNLNASLEEAIKECQPDKLFVLADETTAQLCLPLVSKLNCMQAAQPIIIGATDTNKTL